MRTVHVVQLVESAHEYSDKCLAIQRAGEAKMREADAEHAKSVAKAQAAAARAAKRANAAKKTRTQLLAHQEAAKAERRRALDADEHAKAKKDAKARRLASDDAARAFDERRAIEEKARENAKAERIAKEKAEKKRMFHIFETARTRAENTVCAENAVVYGADRDSIPITPRKSSCNTGAGRKPNAPNKSGTRQCRRAMKRAEQLAKKTAEEATVRAEKAAKLAKNIKCNSSI